MMPEAGLARKFEVLARVLDERTRRLVAAAEAQAIGFGGVTAVAQASRLSRGTIIRGLAELQTASKPARGQRIRRQGAGRKRTMDQDATLKRDLESLVEPVTRGDPESPLRWTCKSVRQLAAQLKRMGHKTSHRMVAEILHSMDYSLHRPTAKPWRGLRTRTGRRSFTTSAIASRPSKRSASPLFPWIPRRKNWWATSKTTGGSGGPRGTRKRCAFTIS